MEGERFTAYLCSRGFWTIGIGRNLDANGLSDTESMAIFGEVLDKPTIIERLKREPITREQSEMLFMSDVSAAEEHCYRNIQMNGNSARRAVIINMCFQLGIGGLLGFENTIAFYESENYLACSVEMLDSLWAEIQTPTRAHIMSEQMRTGEWQ